MTDTHSADGSPPLTDGHGEISIDRSALRTDLWVTTFDGTYRLFLDMPLAVELERKCGFIDKDGNQQGRSFFSIYGRVAKGRYELDGRPVGFAVEGDASISECHETVRLALIGGGNAIVNGQRVRIDASRAAQLVKTYLITAPIEDSWNLAYLILHTAVSGRQQRVNEIGTRSSQAVFPEIEEAEAGDG